MASTSVLHHVVELKGGFRRFQVCEEILIAFIIITCTFVGYSGIKD
jgi:hypothetical protein